jgi:hypothetical protein
MIPEGRAERVPQAFAARVPQISDAERSPRQPADVGRTRRSGEEIGAAIVIAVGARKTAGPIRISNRASDERVSRVFERSLCFALCFRHSRHFAARSVHEKHGRDGRHQNEHEERLAARFVAGSRPATTGTRDSSDKKRLGGNSHQIASVIWLERADSGERCD